MFIRIKNRANGKRAVQIVESHRRGDKIQQKIIRHVGQGINDKEIEILQQLAQTIIVELKEQKQPVLPLFRPEEIYAVKKRKKEIKEKVAIKDLREEQRLIEGIGDIYGKLYTDLGYDDLISEVKKDKQWNYILKHCVLARIANPDSKKRTAALLEQDYGIKIALEKIYRMMDRLALKEEKIKGKIGGSTLQLFDNKVDVLFFDVTTLYFESNKADNLRDFGYSKDCKFNEVQIVLALVTTSEGLPITYELFPGNIYEGHTLIKMIEKMKEQFKVNQLLLVADRAMFSNENLELMEKEKINYIVASRLKSLNKKTKADIIESNDYQAAGIGDEVQWIKEYAYQERRLIVSYSRKRAEKDAKDRARLVERLLKKAKGKKIKIKDIISNQGTKKYLEIKNEEAILNEVKIKKDARWDGLHGVITNLRQEKAWEILSRYKGLWQIEEAFRVSKHDLKMRPIYHWKESRIKAHILICFIAYTLVKQSTYRMKHQKKAMSFEQMREELLHVQASILMDVSTRKKYILPSHTTVNQNKIYQAFGLKRCEVPYELIKGTSKK